MSSQYSTLSQVSPARSLGNVPLNARQSITISGLGSDVFAQALLGMMNIHQHFAQRCPEGQMESWEPRKDRGHPILTLGNRYLSTTRDNENKQPVSVEMDAIDPFHILQGAVPSTVHTKENQVLYFERIPKGNRYAPS